MTPLELNDETSAFLTQLEEDLDAQAGPGGGVRLGTYAKCVSKGSSMMLLGTAICVRADVCMLQTARTHEGADDLEGNWEEHLSSGSESETGHLVCGCTTAILLAQP